MDETRLLQTLKEYFGYENFRPLQKRIISSVFQGDDNLVIMPTGGGKSICYQLPALLLPELTLVISPLIALMKDQVDGLKTNGISAAFLNSSQTEKQQQEIFEQIRQNKLKLLYLAPESLSFVDNLLSAEEISLIAIDEAHCISSWGHDFRPAYTQLGYLKKRYPSTPLMALTATADKATRHDICRQLNIPNAEKHIASFDRKNLNLEVRPGIKRLVQIKKFVTEREQQSGIVYCLSRKATEEVAAKLKKENIKAEAYHAGMKSEERINVQDRFINDETHVVCATIAFGMGIDKSNIRWVIHYNMPKNIEGYYQEIGRAGRDGLPSDTLLFHSYADVIQLQRFAENSGNSEIQLGKLERMKQYAESLTCRRKILLNYFGEPKAEDCGNCDICRNPPQFFDGTIPAQKALSCIYRLKENAPLTALIDVLRGAQNDNVFSHGYQNLKTYGAGRDIPWRNWQDYIIQLINLGYIEIAFHRENSLQLTPTAQKVLFEGDQVQLAKTPEKSEIKTTAQKITTSGLFEKLRELRLEIAREEEIPAYLIFNDATLKGMEKSRPETDEEFLQINGVGRQKMQDYGYRFLKEIREFIHSTKPKKKAAKGNTLQTSLTLYKQGLTPEEIARERKLTLSTVFGHLFKLHQQGKEIDFSQFIDKNDVEAVKKAREKLDNPRALRPYFEHFEEAIDYNTIRGALVIIEQEKQA